MTRHLFSEPAEAFLRATPSSGKTYLYRLDWSPNGSIYGACHGLDLPLLLGDEAAWREAPMLGATPWNIVERLGRQMRAAWSAFARTGDPTSEGGWIWEASSGASDGRITKLALPSLSSQRSAQVPWLADEPMQRDRRML